MAEDKQLDQILRSSLSWINYRKDNANVSYESHDLAKKNLSSYDLSYADFHNSNFEEACLIKSIFDKSNISNCNFKSADLSEASLDDSNAKQSVFNTAVMNNASIVNANLENCEIQRASLHGASLNKAILIEADFSRSDLSHADIANANLENSMFRKANLEKTNLHGSNLRFANFSNSYMQGAYLSHTDLSHTNFQYADLTTANFSKANLNDTIFTRANLNGAKFSSQTSLSRLGVPLTQDQLSSVIFLDELNAAKKNRTEKGNHATLLTIKIPGDSYWTPFDMGCYLAAIQLSYNQMHFLMTTDCDDYDRILDRVSSNQSLIDAKDNIKIKSITSGSLIVELSNLLIDNKAIIAASLAAIAGFTPKLIDSISNYKLAKSSANLNQANAEKARVETRLLIQNEHNDSENPVNPLATVSGKTDIVSDFLLNTNENSDINNALSNIKVRSKEVESNKYNLSILATRSLTNILIKMEELGHGRVMFEIKKDN